MKTNHSLRRVVLVLLLSTLNPQLSTCFAQGSLTPPGAPAPAMKTLAQVEPRTDVMTLPGDVNNQFIISRPGAYYLTTNVAGVTGKYGITIISGNVTLDFNGFALLGVPGSQAGVYIAGNYTNIIVSNGTVSGWGADGVDTYTGGSPRNVVLERLSVSANTGYGIITESASVVRDCLSYSNSSVGIRCEGGLISGCAVRANGNRGIYANACVVDDCRVESNGDDGIYALSSQVRDCQVASSASRGIYITAGTVSGCLVSSSVQSGILVDSPGCQIVGNTSRGNNTSASTSHAGICVNDSDTRVEGNHVTGSGAAGIRVKNPYVNNVVIRNTVSGNGVNNYVDPGSNDFGPIGIAATASSPWANISH